jgi:hypothetical protein
MVLKRCACESLHRVQTGLAPTRCLSKEVAGSNWINKTMYLHYSTTLEADITLVSLLLSYTLIGIEDEDF